MLSNFAITCFFSFLINATFTMHSQTLRRFIPLNDDWKFLLQDDSSAYRPDYNDSSWRTLNLPHDWAFENGYSENGAQGETGGYASGGIGWYRKIFDISELGEAEKRIFIDFDAVYMNSEVWLNGHYLGKRPYGYISFGYEITPYVKPGRNLVSVRVDNSLEPSARWYHGCGIYGKVTLSVVPSSHFKKWGTYVAIPKCNQSRAELIVSSTLDIPVFSKMSRVEYIITDALGKEICRQNDIPISEGNYAQASLIIEEPSLWDLSSPYLYTLTANLWQGNVLVDEKRESFGVRSVSWDAGTGFWLNGRNVKLQGVCEHLEGGPVGAAWTENLLRWKIRMLKNMGCNAIRTAHNPQTPLFYHICDEIGMLVLDEIFDGWNQKAKEDYGKQAFAEWWERDLRDFVRRDRNHPSVIAYSVGNETGGTIGRELVRVCHEEDSLRLVTSGHSNSESMDLFGVNGGAEKQSFIRNYRIGEKAFLGTETPHTWQVRGYYRTKTWYRDGFPNKGQDPFEIPDLTEKELFHYEWDSIDKWKNGKQHLNSSYDNGIVRINARQNMEFLRDLPWYTASFRWTGFDYPGEAGYVHGGWPFRAFMGGVIDMAGFPKDHYFLYQSQWSDQPMVHILPHWTHPDLVIGSKIPVWVYTTGDSAELFLNGRSLGRKDKGLKWDKMQCEWLVPWEKGVLEAVAYSKGEEVARTRQATSGEPAQIQLLIEDACLTEKREDIHILTISQKDSSGVLYPYGENRIYWCIEGDGEIFSAESGSPVDTEANYHATSRKAFFGLLRLFIRQKGDTPTRLYAAAILGDKRLKISNKISIDIAGINLDGTSAIPSSCKIYYTIDGTNPAQFGMKYSEPFELLAGAKVRALVIINDETCLYCEESFGLDEGLYWGNGDIAEKKTNIQSEACTYQGGVMMKDIQGFQAEGYVLLDEKGSIEFYQENDGDKRKVILKFAYTPTNKSPVFLQLYNNGVLTSESELFIGDAEIGCWNIGMIEVDLNNGANLMKMTIKNNAKLGIDWFEFADF